MSMIPVLILISLGLGLIALGAFLWALKSGQYNDLDGAAERILFDEDEDGDDGKGDEQPFSDER